MNRRGKIDYDMYPENVKDASLVFDEASRRYMFKGYARMLDENGAETWVPVQKEYEFAQDLNLINNDVNDLVVKMHETSKTNQEYYKNKK
jgi:hypothetical protein